MLQAFMHCSQNGTDRKIKRIVNTSAGLGHSPRGSVFCYGNVTI